MKFMKGMKALLTSGGADLAGPALPGAVCGRRATRQDRSEMLDGLVGRAPPTYRTAAAGGRQVSDVFMSFMSFMVNAL
jgi:hypothetical protein